MSQSVAFSHVCVCSEQRKKKKTLENDKSALANKLQNAVPIEQHSHVAGLPNQHVFLVLTKSWNGKRRRGKRRTEKRGTGKREREFGNEFTAVIRCKIPLYFDFCIVYNFIELL